MSLPTPPVYKGLPLVGVGPRFLMDPLGVFMDARRAHGDVVEIDFGRFGRSIAVFHPEQAKEVMTRGRRVHRELMRRLIGGGLLVTESGDVSRRHRRMLQPAFHPDFIARIIDKSREEITSILDRRWPELARRAVPFDMGAEMKHLTVAMISKAMFGTSLVGHMPEVREALSFVVGFLDERLFDRVKAPLTWPTAYNERFRRSMATLRAVIHDTVAARRRDGQFGEDMLSLFIQARDEKGEPLSAEELEHEVLSTFIAGTETTGASLTWSWYFLTHHPDKAARLREEVASLGQAVPTLEDLRRYPYARWVLQESMRLRPPAWAIVRKFDEPTQLGGYEIPPDVFVWATPYVTHRHPDFWPEPERFQPERFAPEVHGKQPRFAYFPFGGGPHQCVGADFALLEAQLIITQVVQRFHVEPGDPRPIRLAPRIALEPRPSPRMKIRPN